MLEPAAAISGFNEAIRQLLSLIFDAVDAATEPAVSRAMIELFSFMQCKELTAQERAVGAADFSCEAFGDATRLKLTTLMGARTGVSPPSASLSPKA